MSVSTSGALRAGVLSPTPSGRIPSFDLPVAGGGRVSSSAYRGRKNLVIFFAHGDDPSCRSLLQAFAERYADYQADDAEVIAVIPGPLEVAARLKEQLQLPYPVAADEDGQVRRRYNAITPNGEPAIGLFVTDRFGEVYNQVVLQQGHEIPSQEDILDWVWFIDIQCPECGAPEWPSSP